MHFPFMFRRQEVFFPVNKTTGVERVSFTATYLSARQFWNRACVAVISMFTQSLSFAESSCFGWSWYGSCLQVVQLQGYLDSWIPGACDAAACPHKLPLGDFKSIIHHYYYCSFTCFEVNVAEVCMNYGPHSVDQKSKTLSWVEFVLSLGLVQQ